MQPPITPASWLQSATEQLQQASIPSARLDAEVILAHALSVNRSWLHAHSDDTINSTDADKLLQKRITRVPIAYLTGQKEFYGRTFIVTPETLIPRPETETLIDIAKQYELGGKIVDVGTGSGCIGITLALETSSTVTLCDISDEALRIAQKNAQQLGVSNLTFTKSDLLSAFAKKTSAPFDAIVANLPYVDHSWERSPETDHEPALALFANDKGLELIKTLIDQAPALLRPGGYLLLEADPEQFVSISQYSAPAFTTVETRDYAILLQKTPLS